MHLGTSGLGQAGQLVQGVLGVHEGAGCPNPDEHDPLEAQLAVFDLGDVGELGGQAGYAAQRLAVGQFERDLLVAVATTATEVGGYLDARVQIVRLSPEPGKAVGGVVSAEIVLVGFSHRGNNAPRSCRRMRAFYRATSDAVGEKPAAASHSASSSIVATMTAGPVSSTEPDGSSRTVQVPPGTSTRQDAPSVAPRATAATTAPMPVPHDRVSPEPRSWTRICR